MKRTIQSWLRLLLLTVGAFAIFSSCNKDLPVATPIVTPAPSGSSILEVLNDPNYSILKAAVARAATFSSPTGNISTLLGDKNAVVTFFAPDDAAFIGSGIPSAAAIATLRPGFLDTVLKYHLVGGQKFGSASIPTTFPNNLYLQSMLLLAAPSAALPPGLRMPIFPGKTGPAMFANNIPVTQADIAVANGTMHKVARIVAPPSQYLWERINADTSMSYLKAAIIRADSGVAAPNRLQDALVNPAANLTIFAPTNAAFRALLTGQITLALIAMGTDPATAAATAAALASTPNVFATPALYPVITPTLVKGIVVYHILGVRAFSVNLPPVATLVKTLLNTAIAAHPGVTVQATFGPTGVTAATVKGLANATASNLLINPTPAPAGNSDQHYINGVIHKIDQVLLPQ
ncbi:MAG TPA: fasciclin domain-containing protein [Chitinophagaceae bacterium]|nr:fasciclin domain-containing protein [Chitinophagaceae bacterium]